MSVRSAVLDITVDASAKGLDTFDAVGAGARGMGDDLATAAAKADTAAGKFDSVASSADNLDTKAGAATGAMGALSSGFELIGADKAAAGLQAAAMATDFLSGAGQALNLVMDLEIVKKVTAAGATAAHTAVTIAHTAVTKTAAAGQWLLNAALSANPIGLVVIALVALTAGVVLAYKKSETFREVVSASLTVVTANFRLVAAAVEVVVGWLRDKVPPAFSWIQDKAAGVIDAAFHPIETAKGLFEGFRDFVRDKIQPAVTTMKDAVVPVLETLATPITAAKNAVESLITWIGKIDWPSPPDWLNKIPGVNFRGPVRSPLAPSPTVTTTSSSSTADAAVIVLLTAIKDLLTAASTRTSAPVDTSTLARLLADVLRREGLIFGTPS